MAAKQQRMKPRMTTKWMLRLPPDLVDGLREIAEREDRTPPATARLALREFVAARSGMTPAAPGSASMEVTGV